jgi:hypothetical protein
MVMPLRAIVRSPAGVASSATASEWHAQYDHGIAIGRFTWWYENGQKQAEVDYCAGALGGTWVTWHSNGRKESQAEFRDRELVDQWMHWNADGKLAETRHFHQPMAQQVPQAQHAQQGQPTTKASRTTTRQLPPAVYRSR